MTKKLIEITSDEYSCGASLQCPAIFKSCEFETSCPTLIKDGDKCIIIGKIVTVNEYPILEGRIGSNEIAVEIPFDLIKKSIHE